MIKAQILSLTEASTLCTLDEFVKLSALYAMGRDIESQQAREISERRERR